MPKSTRQTISFRAFGGIKTDTDPADRQGLGGPLYADRMVDCYPAIDGTQIVAQPGLDALGGGLVNAGQQVQGVFTFYPKVGTAITVAKVPDGYYYSRAGSAWALLKQTWGGYGLVPSFAVCNDKLHIVDGENAFYVDSNGDDTEWTGLPAPKSNISDAGVKTPNLTAEDTTSTGLTLGATYEVIFTFWDDTNSIESPPSEPMRIKITETAHREILVHTGYAKSGIDTIMPYAPASATHVKVYCSAKNTVKSDDLTAAGAWYEATKTAIPSSGEIVGSVLVEPVLTTYMENFYGPPPGTKSVTTHMARLYVSGSKEYPTRLWYTDVLNTLRFYIENFIDVDSDNPDNCILTTASMSGTLFVFRKYSVWVITGNGGETFQAQELNGAEGCVNGDSVIKTPYGILYAGQSGINWIGLDLTCQGISTGYVRDEYQKAIAARVT